MGLRRYPGFTAAWACYISTPPTPRELDTVAAYLIYLPTSPSGLRTVTVANDRSHISRSQQEQRLPQLHSRTPTRDPFCNQPTYFTTEHRQPEQAPTRDSRRSRALALASFKSARARGRHVYEGRKRTTGLGEANRKRLVVRSHCRPRGSIAPRLLASSRLENGRPQLCHIQPGSQSPCGW